MHTPPSPTSREELTGTRTDSPKSATKRNSERLNWRRLLLGLVRYWWLLAIAVIAVAVAVVVKSVESNPPVQVAMVRNTRIDITPEEIRAIRQIGQWEFLSVSTEEMVEWHRKHFMGDDHLTRIYSGTLRLGIDMQQASDDWFASLPDSACRLRLPAISLLDTLFIDEARTRSFYEKGSIPPEAREQLYRQARQAMLRRLLTPSNLQAAEENARDQLTRIFSAMGFKKIDITFIPDSLHKP
ncbi:MAG: DUF4230 domain-containing protein [Bacteroidales bacterium]|nr:DUF4230 domain-containing protein [Bacteroidales bacterium]